LQGGFQDLPHHEVQESRQAAVAAREAQLTTLVEAPRKVAEGDGTAAATPTTTMPTRQNLFTGCKQASKQATIGFKSELVPFAPRPRQKCTTREVPKTIENNNKNKNNKIRLPPHGVVALVHSIPCKHPGSHCKHCPGPTRQNQSNYDDAFADRLPLLAPLLLVVDWASEYLCLFSRAVFS
jgi:hypothetical protein